MKKLIYSLIICILAGIVLISGCTSPSTGLLNYSNGIVSFKYPNDFKYSTAPNDTFTDDLGWDQIIFLSNNQKIGIRLQSTMNPSSIDATTYVSTANYAINYRNGHVLSTSNNKNPNGVEIAETVFKLNDPTNKTLLRYDYMVFNVNNQTYTLYIVGPDSSSSKISDVRNIIFNSLKVT